jgi:hypothetical protein
MDYQDDTENSSGSGDDSTSNQGDSGSESDQTDSSSTASDTGSDNQNQSDGNSQPEVQIPAGTDISAPNDMEVVPVPPPDTPPVDNPNYTAPDSGNADDSTAHVDYDPNNPPQPVMRAPDGTERPLSGDDRPEEVHDVEDGTTVESSQGGGNTDAEGGP